MRLASPVVLVAALLAGCAAAPPSSPPDSLLVDRLFAPPREAIRTDDLFAMSDAMRRYLAVDIADQLRPKGAQIGLAEALQKHAQLRLEYDVGADEERGGDLREPHRQLPLAGDHDRGVRQGARRSGHVSRRPISTRPGAAPATC